MRHRDLERVETELGLDLPEHYRQFILKHRIVRDIGKLSLPEAHLQSWIISRPSRLIEVNESIPEQMPLAGLTRWPEDWFVFGEDGCGDFLILDIARGKSVVLSFDHERDEISRLDNHFGAYLAGLLMNLDSTPVVVHSKREAHRQNALPWRAPAVPGRGAPRWQTDAGVFMDEYKSIVRRAKSHKERIKLTNQEFASKPICWEGMLTQIGGAREHVHVDFGDFRRDVGAFRFRLGRHILDLRYERQSQSPQIITRLEDWQKVDADCRVRIVFMVAPGDHEGACVHLISDLNDVFNVHVSSCGAHLVKILR